MRPTPVRYELNYLASPTPCPNCLVQGGLFISSKLTAEQRDGGLVASWIPALCCDGCDLYLVGRFTPSGNTIVFADFGGEDEASSAQS